MSAEAKAVKLEELFAKKRAIQDEINALLEPEKETVRVLPPGFSLYTEIESILKENPDGVLAESILRLLGAKFPSYGITQKDVTATLVYLANKRKSAERIGRGIYRIKEKRVKNEEIDASNISF